MTITRCNKCGNLMHEADRCFVCGNTVGFTKIDSAILIHENVADEYARLERLVRNGEFTEALTLSKLVLEWMPTCSDVFWLRLLAKNECRSDEALVCNGVACEDSADYYNAVLFANGVQKKVYLGIADKLSAAKTVLKKYITMHEYAEKNSTAILQIQSEFPTEIEIRKNNMFALWEKLQQIEANMLLTEEDCMLLVEEYRDAMDRTCSEAKSIKAAAYKMTQCTAEQLHKYKIQFETLLYRTSQAKSNIESIRSKDPLVEKFRDLTAKRDDIANKINKEIDALKAYERKMQSTVSEIEQIEVRHAAAIASVELFDFKAARNLLGEDLFASAFAEVGMK